MHLLLAASLSASPVAFAQAARPSEARAAGVVLLASGQVLHGTVADEGEQALVTLGPGSQLRLPHDQIVCTGRTHDELFAYQHRQLAAGDVPGRIELARWCLRSDLPTAAGRMLVELVALAPDDPRVRSLEQQLRGRARQPAERPTAEVSPDLPPAAELKVVASQVSPPAFDAYVRHIQPLLVNHCSASGCHGVASKSDFQLLRPLTGVKLTQRMMQRNLHSTLAQVDRTTPLASPILAAATEPHAGAAGPLLHERTDRAQIEALRQWLLAIERRPEISDEPAAAQTPPTVLGQPRDTPRRPAPTAPPPPPARNSPPANDRTPPETRRTRPDADEFNRQFFPERFEAASAP